MPGGTRARRKRGTAGRVAAAVGLGVLLLGGSPEKARPSDAAGIRAGGPDPRATAASMAPSKANAPLDPKAPLSAKTPAIPGAPSAADSLRWRGPVAVRGGRILSTGDARARLGGEAAGTVMSREEIRRALGALGQKLIDQGYLEAELQLEARPGERAVLDVREGPAARMDSVKVRTDPRSDSLVVKGTAGELPRPRGVSVRISIPSGRFDADRFQRLLWDWIDVWTENGHPFASARVDSLIVEKGHVRAAIRFDPGPRVQVSQVSFPGRVNTRESFLLRWIRFHPGVLYRESEWDARRSRLEQSGLFGRVDDPSLEQGADGLHIALPVEESKHNQLDGAIGYSGVSKTVSGFFDLQLGDLFGTGRQAGFRWERLQPNQSRLNLNYHEPLLGPLPAGLRVSLQQEVQDSSYTLAVWEGTVEAMVGWDLTAYAGGEYRRSVIGPQPSELSSRLSSLAGGRWDTIRPGRFRGGRLEASFRSGENHVRPAGGGPIQSSLLNRATLDGER